MKIFYYKGARTDLKNNEKKLALDMATNAACASLLKKKQSAGISVFVILIRFSCFKGHLVFQPNINILIAIKTSYRLGATWAKSCAWKGSLESVSSAEFLTPHKMQEAKEFRRCGSSKGREGNGRQALQSGGTEGKEGWQLLLKTVYHK